jgi:crotonobetainyl-CoA:carnitine CoA-transferase CaiB-like acyl-CoA transferase
MTTTPLPYAGIRVLDISQGIAGPYCAHILWQQGARVIKVEPPSGDWIRFIGAAKGDLSAHAIQFNAGKQALALDARTEAGKKILLQLALQADVIVHGYRADAIEKLGFGEAARQAINPDLIDVALNAYGWTGPLANRRGFDTIVQMSAGLAHSEMQHANSHSPQQLPVQALDYGTGHMMAAAVIRALSEAQQGSRSHIRLSLARTAALLAQFRGTDDEAIAPESDHDLQTKIEVTYWGQVRRLNPPLNINGLEFAFSRPAGLLGSDTAAFARS